MKNFLDAFINSVNNHDPSLLPMADRYYAIENGVPAALLMLESFRLIDHIVAIGTVAEDPQRNTVYGVLSAAMGRQEVIVGVRLTGEDNKISELEINIYHSRSECGFWYAPQDVAGWEPAWDYIVPEEQRADRETLERFARAIFDNTMDGSEFPPAETCQLMESGGLVYENIEYAKLLSPNPDALVIPEGKIRIPMGFGLGPIRPFGEDMRILCVDEEKCLVVVVGCMDGYVSPYIVSDETSSCFVPLGMIEFHHKSLSEEKFKGQIACKEMYASAENTTIAKFYDGKIQFLTQNVRLRPFGCKASWRDDVFVK